MLKHLFVTLVIGWSSLIYAWQPTGPIKVVVGQAPGGGNELAIRGIIPIIERNNPGASFVVETHPGLDSVVAMNHFANQKPDGQTLLVTVAETSFIASPIAYKSQIQVDPNNYVPITTLAQGPLAFIVPIDSSIKDVPALIAKLRDKNNKFNIGISGSTNLLAYSYFIKNLNLESDRVQAINYNSPTAATLGVASKDLDLAIVSIASAKSLIGTKVKLLAYTSDRPIPGLEQYSLMRQYVPGLIINTSWSVFLPPGTSIDIVAWYTEQFKKSLATAEAREYFHSNWSAIDNNDVGPQGLTNHIKLLKQQWINTANMILTEKK